MLGAYKCRSKEKDDREMEIEKDLRQNLRDRDESTLPFFCLGGGTLPENQNRATDDYRQNFQ